MRKDHEQFQGALSGYFSVQLLLLVVFFIGIWVFVCFFSLQTDKKLVVDVTAF